MSKKDWARFVADIESSSLRVIAPNETKKRRRLFAHRILSRLSVMGALRDKPLKKSSS